MKAQKALLAVVVAVVTGIGLWVVFRNDRDDRSMMEPTDSIQDDGVSRMSGEAAVEEENIDGEMMESGDGMGSNGISTDVANRQETSSITGVKGSGEYMDYAKSAFDQAIGKRRILFFYANWCPICRPADVDIRENIAKLPSDVVVFRVNYNDTDTDDDEKMLAKEYGITYQHTFVQVDGNGDAVTKWNGGKMAELLSNIK